MKGKKGSKAMNPTKGVAPMDKAPKEVYAGGGSNVVKEAKAKKKGGKVSHKVHGKMSKMRLDRPGRKRGGRVGSDKNPLSSAANVSSPVGHKESKECD